MGPRALARGNSDTEKLPSVVPYWLQWGRGLSPAEIKLLLCLSKGLLDASMGPRALARGNLCRSLRLAGVRVASMGPRALARGNEEA